MPKNKSEAPQQRTNRAEVIAERLALLRREHHLSQDALGSLVGASANLIVAGFAERSGHPIRFLPFMLAAFPLMLMSIAVSTVYVYFRYF